MLRVSKKSSSSPAGTKEALKITLTIPRNWKTRCWKKEKRKTAGNCGKLLIWLVFFFVRQRDPLGLGHAVLCAESFVGNDPFAVLLGDDIVHHTVPCLEQLMEAYRQTKSTILGVQGFKECSCTKDWCNCTRNQENEHLFGQKCSPLTGRFH